MRPHARRKLRIKFSRLLEVELENWTFVESLRFLIVSFIMAFLFILLFGVVSKIAYTVISNWLLF